MGHRPPRPLQTRQEATCKQLGITAVEAERFRDAKVVRDLGDGATEIEDGRGTRLVVVPGRGIVLPASGRGPRPELDSYLAALSTADAEHPTELTGRFGSA